MNLIAAIAQEEFSFFRELVHLCITLFLVLGLAFITLAFVKRTMRARSSLINRGCAIKVLEKRALHPKASLYLVDILGKGVVISESAAGIQLITEFASDINVELLLNTMDEKKAPVSSFSERLKSLITKRSTPTQMEK